MMGSWPFVITFFAVMIAWDRNLEREPSSVRVDQGRRADLERLAGYCTATITMA
jgi:hypothetical protein